MPRTPVLTDEQQKNLLSIVGDSPEGVSSQSLLAEFGLTRVQLSNVLSKLTKQGLIHAVGKTRGAKWFAGPAKTAASAPRAKTLKPIVLKVRKGTALELALQSLENEEKRLAAELSRVHKSVEAVRKALAR